MSFSPERGYVMFRYLLLLIRLSVCLSSVTLVHPTQPAEIFGNVFYAILYPSHPRSSMQNFTEIVPG